MSYQTTTRGLFIIVLHSSRMSKRIPKINSDTAVIGGAAAASVASSGGGGVVTGVYCKPEDTDWYCTLMKATNGIGSVIRLVMSIIAFIFVIFMLYKLATDKSFRKIFF